MRTMLAKSELYGCMVFRCSMLWSGSTELDTWPQCLSKAVATTTTTTLLLLLLLLFSFFFFCCDAAAAAAIARHKPNV